MKTIDDFTVGDVVSLVSGGPEMTVVKICKGAPSPQAGVPATEDDVHCWWFDKPGPSCSQLCKATFPPGCLNIDSQKPAPTPELAPPEQPERKPSDSGFQSAE